jgi:hypothetical protein
MSGAARNGLNGLPASTKVTVALDLLPSLYR